MFNLLNKLKLLKPCVYKTPGSINIIDMDVHHCVDACVRVLMFTRCPCRSHEYTLYNGI